MAVELDRVNVFVALIAMTFLVFVVFLVIGFDKRNEMIRFEREKKLVKAVVIGYTKDDAPNWTGLVVTIPERNDNKSYSVDSWGTSIADYPKGKVISVWSMEKKTLGINYPMLWLPDKSIPTPAKASGLFFAFSGVSLLAMVILIIHFIIL